MKLRRFVMARRRGVVAVVAAALVAAAAPPLGPVATSVPEPAPDCQRGAGLEPACRRRPDDAVRCAGAGRRSNAAGHDVAPGDGPRGDLRRRQRDRRRLPALPARTAGGVAVGVSWMQPSPPPPTTCSSGWAPSHRCRRPSSPGLDGSVRGGAGGDSRRRRQDGRDRRRGRRRGGDARDASRRRSLRAVLPSRRRSTRRVASDPSRRGQRPVRVGGQRRAVHARQPVAVPLGGATRARQRRVRDRVQRGQGTRRRRQCTQPRATGRRRVLHVNSVELFNRTFRTVAEAEGLTLAEEARLFAMVNVAAADSLINCWDDKAYWHFWRPITAIHEGDNDGNDDTVGDPAWEPMIPTPPYPDHTSGYNCLSAAMMHAPTPSSAGSRSPSASSGSCPTPPR